MKRLIRIEIDDDELADHFLGATLESLQKTQDEISQVGGLSATAWRALRQAEIERQLELYRAAPKVRFKLGEQVIATAELARTKVGSKYVNTVSELKAPVRGVIVGRRSIPTGTVKGHFDNDGDQEYYTYFEVDEQTPVWLVAYQLNRHPLRVPDEHVEAMFK